MAGNCLWDNDRVVERRIRSSAAGRTQPNYANGHPADGGDCRHSSIAGKHCEHVAIESLETLGLAVVLIILATIFPGVRDWRSSVTEIGVRGCNQSGNYQRITRSDAVAAGPRRHRHEFHICLVQRWRLHSRHAVHSDRGLRGRRRILCNRHDRFHDREYRLEFLAVVDHAAKAAWARISRVAIDPRNDPRDVDSQTQCTNLPSLYLCMGDEHGHHIDPYAKHRAGIGAD